MRRFLLVSALVLVAGAFLAAQAQTPTYQLPPGVRAGAQPHLKFRGTGRSSFVPLKVSQGARASGMGDAFVAVADDITAVFWNPAGLTHVERFEYTAGYTKWMVDSKFFSGAMAYHVGQHVLGVSLVTFNSGESLETTPTDPTGRLGTMVSSSDFFVNLAYARKVTDKLSVAVAGKWIYERLHKDVVQSASFDFSSLFYTGFKSVRIAMALRNFGKDQTVQIPGSIPSGNTAQPMVYTVAGAMEVYGKKGQAVSLTASGELAYFIDDKERFHAGAELWLANTLALRAGYRWNYYLGDWTVGAGVKREFGQSKIGVDFSFVHHNETMNSPVRVSLVGGF